MKSNAKIWGLIVLLTLALFGYAQPTSQKNKRIFITLDVSGSMRGNKYVMANYAAQTISVFSNSGDLVYLYYLGEKHNITDPNGYKTIQKSYQSLSSKKDNYYEISDLTSFLKSYHPDSNYQDWLFIVGDGDWDYRSAKSEYDSTTEKLASLFEREQLHVCYLQTGNNLENDYAFTEFMQNQNSSFIDVRKSDTLASSVLGNCIYFANRILGFSNSSVSLHSVDGSTVTFSSEFPLERCLLVYQSDKMTKEIAKITSVECNGASVSVQVKGNPSTKPLVNPGKTALEGVVWELKCPQTISANETVQVHFNQEIDVRALTLYPYVDVMIGMRPWSVNMDTLLESRPGYFKICNREDRVLVKINATDKYGHKFIPPLMQRMEVRLVTSEGEVMASYSEADTSFVAVLPMPNDAISCYSVVESPGYFNRVSQQQSVEKSSEVCPPERVPLIELPVQKFDPVTFELLKNGGGFGGQIGDSLFCAVVSSGSFENVSLMGHDSWMLENANLTMDGDVALLTQKPISGMCECTFPDTLRYVVSLTSGSGVLYDGKLYEGFKIPVLVPVDERGWWNRCWVYVALFFGLLLFLIYLRVIRKKCRFGKEACVKAIQIDEWGNEIDKNYSHYLRKKGFGSWLNRWFWPGDEKNTLSYVNPRVNAISFKAGSTPSTILVPTKNVDFRKLKIGDYDPEEELEFVKLGDNETITIGKDETEGYLQYITGGKNDGAVFNAINVVMTLAVAAAEAFVFWMLIKSLIIMV